jgi:hypothetical protein
VKHSIEEAHAELMRFLAHAKQPAVLDAGQEPIPLVAGAYNVERSGDRLFLEAWTRDRTLARRVTGLLETTRHTSRFTVERFGKKEGVVELTDLSAPSADVTQRKATRHTYRERFRRSLLRQFPGWRVAELSAEPDLENSLSPAYPRALLKKQNVARAAIGCPSQSNDVDGVLTAGLIWLDYLRRRDPSVNIDGLSVFLPEGRHRAVCLRMLYLRSDRTHWDAFVYTERTEDRVDLRDYGNIVTELPVRGAPGDHRQEWWMRRLSILPEVTEREEHGGTVSWTVHGLEFARWNNSKGLVFGLETKRKGHESNASEIEALARELVRLRSAKARDRANPLYLRKPELWLEAQVRLALREVDASLDAGPVYRQAPALTCGDRSVLDLLAVDYAGRLAVVEVKVTEDLHLPLQALDYWIRVQWHASRDDFRRSGYFPGKCLQTTPPRLLLVAPALQLHPTTQLLIDYFAPQVEVDTIGLAMNWREEVRVMFRTRRETRSS